jgi:hypothetical protein
MIAAFRRWVRYRRALGRSIDAVYATGYKVSPGEYDRLKAAAREEAGR